MASDYKVHNDTVNQTVVVMDSGREDHVIPADGTAVFTRANPLDRPTFKVYWDLDRDGTKDSEAAQAEMKVGYWDAITASGEYTFNGKELG